MGWEDIPPETPAWKQEFNYCKNCERLEAENVELKKTIAELEAEDSPLEDAIKSTVSDLMTWDELADRVLELEAENTKLSELFDASGQDNNILHKRVKTLGAELARCREMYQRDA